MLQKTVPLNNQEITFNEFKKEVLQDYRTAKISRECSLLGSADISLCTQVLPAVSMIQT